MDLTITPKSPSPLEQLIAGTHNKPQVILMYGRNCAPCARLKPRLAQACADLEVDLHQFDAAEEMDTVRLLGLRIVPSVLLLAKDKPARLVFAGDNANPRLTLVAAGVPVPGLPAA